MKENELMTNALGVCFKIHEEFGPGLFESVYEALFCHEWEKTGIPFQRQQPIPLVRDNVQLGIGFRADLIIDNCIILEIKSVESLQDVHFKQVLTYLKLTDLRLGALINFNVAYLKNGIRRVANGM
jgi:GxxExxY protein